MADNNEKTFAALGKMGDQNKDITLFPTVVETRTAKGGAHLTFGIDAATGQKLFTAMADGTMGAKYVVVCIVADRAQFEAIKAGIE